MKRSMLLAVGVLLIAAALGTAYAQEGQAGQGDEQGDNLAAIRGAAVFAEFCQACHGPQGEATGTGAAFAAVTYHEDTTSSVIQQGGDIMPAYGKLLSEGQLSDVLAYLETWESGSVPPLPEPNIHNVPASIPGYPGDPQAGAVVYAKYCVGCHGLEGEGRGQAGFPAFEFTDISAQIVSDEHVPAFGEASGGPLSDQQITDLNAYMATWQTAENSGETTNKGINVLIVVVGVLAVVTIGGAYLSRVIATERA
jgi:mono/diheme cytochrome c family protein